MSDRRFKRLLLDVDIDDDDESAFSDSTDEWQAKTNRNNEKRKRYSTTRFASAVDTLSLSPISNDAATSAAKYDLRGFTTNAIDFKSKSSRVNTKFMPAKGSRSNQGTMTTKKPKKQESLKDVGRWKPCDDLLLIISILQLNDLDMVFAAVKFSCKFTFDEVQTRWNALLHDDLVSSTARAAIRKLHPEKCAAIQRRAPFSLAEEDLLCEILSTENPLLTDFAHLLEKYAETFYISRTPKTLHQHWRLLKKFQLLRDQRPTNENCAAGQFPLNFSDAETELANENFEETVHNGHVNQEMKLWDQQVKRRIRLLEHELGNWMQLLGVSSKVMDLNPKFDSKTIALLRGQRIRYEMRKNCISFGRFTVDGETIDVDLSIEGPAFKISRFQGCIELRDDGTFVTRNYGKRPFFVDGKSVLPKKCFSLCNNNSIFEVSGITFAFTINKKLVDEICLSESGHIESD